MSEVSSKMWLKPPGMIRTAVDNNPKLYFGLSKNSLTSKYKQNNLKLYFRLFCGGINTCIQSSVILSLS